MTIYLSLHSGTKFFFSQYDAFRSPSDNDGLLRPEFVDDHGVLIGGWSFVVSFEERQCEMWRRYAPMNSKRDIVDQCIGGGRKLYEGTVISRNHKIWFIGQRKFRRNIEICYSFPNHGCISSTQSWI